MPGTDFNTTTTREPPAPPAPRGKRLVNPPPLPCCELEPGLASCGLYFIYTGGGFAMVVTRLARWGNSQAVRLPKSVLEQSGVALGDELEARV